MIKVPRPLHKNPIRCTNTGQRVAVKMQSLPGGWHCPKCKFRLTSSVLYARSGTVGASHAIPEPCPNDGMPMEPDTWREDAMQMAEHMQDAACMERINLLQASGAEVTIMRVASPSNRAIEVCAEWTGWNHRRFVGETLLRALNAAVQHKMDREPK